MAALAPYQRPFGKPALHYACQRGHSNVVKIFMENATALSIDLNKIDNDGLTAFHVACIKGSLDVVKIFIENGCDAVLDQFLVIAWRRTLVLRKKTQKGFKYRPLTFHAVLRLYLFQ